MAGSTQSGNPPALEGSDKMASQPSSTASQRTERPALEEPELEAALQLLVERAQYITGATGTALALPQSGEMVCRASAGSCAPAIGARLQVRSGLTGESIARRQLLRCDNAETDPRVNLEACRALGIASIVVLPLLRQNGEVRGLFELFSDHPYAFEERDLVALERMVDLTITALDLAEERHGAIPPLPPSKQADAVSSSKASAPKPAAVSAAPTASAPQETPNANLPLHRGMPTPFGSSSHVAAPEAIDISAQATAPHVSEPIAEAFKISALGPTPASQDPSALPATIQRLQKCASCGFPVSEGRTLCLDCENKQDDPELLQHSNLPPIDPPRESVVLPPSEVLPPFLAKAAPVKESWLSDHLNLLAILVLILGVLVAFVVFR